MANDASSAAGPTPRRRAIVHLVHGTWPRGLLARFLPFLGQAKLWFEKGSEFRNAIEGPEIECKEFKWSGANSVRARAKWAAQLRELLLKTRKEAPDVVQLVIAHSHGGNVAVQALSGPEGQGLADGVVTLGTPFLHVRSRMAEAFEATAMELSQLFGFFLPAMIAMFLWLPSQMFSFKDWKSVPLTTRAIALAIFVVLWILGVQLSKRWKASRIRVVEAAGSGPDAGLPLLIVRAPRDEASVVLAVAQLADVALETAWRLVRRVVRLLPLTWMEKSRLGAVLGFIYVCGTVFSLGILAAAVAYQSWSAVVYGLWMEPVEAGYSVAGIYFTRAVFAVLLAVGLPALAVLLPLGVMLVIAGLALAPFGWELVFAGLTLEVNAEATPAGSAYPVETIQPDRSELERVRMRHSLHELPSVRSRLLQWIIEHQEKAPARGPGDASP